MTIDATSSGVAPRLARVVGASVPLRLRAWDGSSADLGQDPVATLVLRRRRAVRTLLARPGELGMVRAFVSGDLEVEGDLETALGAVVSGDDLGAARRRRPPLGDVVRLWGLGLPPAPPATEVRLRGRRHSMERDRRAVSHHYDVGNDFYRLLLGPSLVYSCAYWDGAGTLEEAQEAKLDLVAAKLGLAPGMRLLDVGCGWGSFLLHAATRYGVRGVGVTLSHEQADLARKRAATAGVSHLVDVRLRDYRDLDGEEFDAVSSIGMAEHVGTAELDAYAARLAALVRPGGRVLHHTIGTRDLRPWVPRAGFVNRYVFPDGELQPLHRTVEAIERAGLEVRDVQALREHYTLTLRAWVANLREHRAELERLAGAERVRVWELYLIGSALSFERAAIGVNQVLAVRPGPSGASGMPAGRPEAAGSLARDPAADAEEPPA